MWWIDKISIILEPEIQISIFRNIIWGIFLSNMRTLYFIVWCIDNVIAFIIVSKTMRFWCTRIWNKLTFFLNHLLGHLCMRVSSHTYVHSQTEWFDEHEAAYLWHIKTFSGRFLVISGSEGFIGVQIHLWNYLHFVLKSKLEKPFTFDMKIPLQQTSCFLIFVYLRPGPNGQFAILTRTV